MRRKVHAGTGTREWVPLNEKKPKNTKKIQQDGINKKNTEHENKSKINQAKDRKRSTKSLKRSSKT